LHGQFLVGCGRANLFGASDEESECRRFGNPSSGTASRGSSSALLLRCLRPQWERRQQNMEIGMRSGDAVQQIVDDLVNASPALLD
jgi:hypothetical protein